MTDQSKEQEIRDALAAATPGPWDYAVFEDGRIIIFDSTFLSRHIAEIVSGGVESAAREDDNANLIANAHEWLQYLLDKVDVQQKSIYDATDEILTLRGAISEAITIWETMDMEDDPVDTMHRVFKRLKEARVREQ